MPTPQQREDLFAEISEIFEKIKGTHIFTHVIKRNTNLPDSKFVVEQIANCKTLLGLLDVREEKEKQDGENNILLFFMFGAGGYEMRQKTKTHSYRLYRCRNL